MLKALICLCLILLPVISVVGEKAPPGRWKRIRNLERDYFVNIAKFAVDEHNSAQKINWCSLESSREGSKWIRGKEIILKSESGIVRIGQRYMRHQCLTRNIRMLQSLSFSGR
ncbi:hypothetical protein Bca52824_075461 [Brassica carinata]|uniref:Uncharacterized protein n=1 Tax=Brassica carinata TaxID=52824 RepID=A0A8X7PSZ4_BRACI|nr:hypothetical protein Bca52824_075461 [Brassica carinata]